jgi:NADPH-ferrihemoprotein reductase
LKAYYSDPVHPGLELRSSSGTVLSHNSPSQKRFGYDAKSPLDCKVVLNRELHGPTSDRSCRHVEIDLGDLKYEAGDHLGIFPQNDTSIVLQLAPRLGLNIDGAEGGDLNRIIKLVVADQEEKTELGPCSIRQALVNLSDITSVPRKSLLKTLAFYATNPEERKKLEILASNDSEQPAGESPSLVLLLTPLSSAFPNSFHFTFFSSYSFPPH